MRFETFSSDVMDEDVVVFRRTLKALFFACDDARGAKFLRVPGNYPFFDLK